MSHQKQINVALAGNPNSGKTTLFNALTGASQYVGNWPGVTVEKKEGPLRGDKNINLIDLPGIYSLSPYTPEEKVSMEYLINERPDVVLNIVDATNLERSLYLTSMLLETGLPVVLALNMSDLTRKRGDEINAAKLSERLGCPIIEISALRGKGIKPLVQAVKKAATPQAAAALKGFHFTKPVEQAIYDLENEIGARAKDNLKRWHAIQFLEQGADEDNPFFSAETLAIAEKLEDVFDDDSESIITGERYEIIADLIQDTVHYKTAHMTLSDRIDRVVTNRYLAFPIFAVIMFLVYYLSIMSLGGFVTDWIEEVFFPEIISANVAGWLTGIGASNWVISLVVDGVISGVGAVLTFLPQMAILFVLLTFLEDVGYMARVAFIMDRLFRRFGLSGKSFIPMLISSGCAVPGIMATKTIENEKDRRMTIITTSFIPCSAKLPIIALIAGSIFGGGWWVAPLMYFVGVAAVIVSGVMLKKTTLFAGEPAPFIMELPQYRLPAFKNMMMHVWERIKSFVVRAGTIIFASSVVIWFLLTFGIEGGGFAMVNDVSNSFIAMVGSVFAVLFAPLGFGNWQASVGVISGFIAKENLVSTLAVIQGVSGGALDAVVDHSAPIWGFVQSILPTAAAGLSFLLFNMLCAPCFAAIGATRRQMQNAKWTAFTVVYQMVFAYAVSLMVYQFGTFFATGLFTIGTFAAIVVLAVFAWLLFRPAPKVGEPLTAHETV